MLVGEGRAFSAGGDFGWFPELRDMAALDALRRDAKQMIWDLLDIEVPIVCGLNGSAAGLGASIALLCDLIVMSERAVIVDPHVNVGLVAGDGGAAIWPLLLGPLAAKRHLLLGEPLTAADALRLGVAAEVCAPEAGARASASPGHERLAAQPPLAVKGTKQAVNAQLKQALLTSFDLSTALEIPCFLSRDHAEAIDALREKRTPDLRRDDDHDDSAIEAIMTTRAMRRFSDRPVERRRHRDLPAGRAAGAQRRQRAAAAVRGGHRPRPCGPQLGALYQRAYHRYEQSLPEPTAFDDEAQGRRVAAHPRRQPAPRRPPGRRAGAGAVPAADHPVGCRRRRGPDGHRPPRCQRVSGGAELLRRRSVAGPRHGPAVGVAQPRGRVLVQRAHHRQHRQHVTEKEGLDDGAGALPRQRERRAAGHQREQLAAFDGRVHQREIEHARHHQQRHRERRGEQPGDAELVEALPVALPTRRYRPDQQRAGQHHGRVLQQHVRRHARLGSATHGRQQHQHEQAQADERQPVARVC